MELRKLLLIVYIYKSNLFIFSLFCAILSPIWQRKFSILLWCLRYRVFWIWQHIVKRFNLLIWGLHSFLHGAWQWIIFPHRLLNLFLLLFSSLPHILFLVNYAWQLIFVRQLPIFLLSRVNCQSDLLWLHNFPLFNDFVTFGGRFVNYDPHSRRNVQIIILLNNTLDFNLWFRNLWQIPFPFSC